MEGWVSRPDDVDVLVQGWAAEHADVLRVESLRQYAGRRVWALTITDPAASAEGKARVLTFRPHAHEPAATAGQVSFLAALLTGRHLDGRPAELDRARVLSRCELAFILDANPEGTARAPVEAWDGSRYTNDEFWGWMRGVDPLTGGMWKRVDLWDDRLEPDRPERTGIVYEQVSDHEWVEPNRHQRSTLFAWLRELWARQHWGFMLDLHQTEFVGQTQNCMVILPPEFGELPVGIQQCARPWAERLIEAWSQTEGGRPALSAEPLGYTGAERQYFLDSWGTYHQQTPMLTVEVQNNTPDTPPRLQMRLIEVAIRETVAAALDWAQDSDARRR